jgi:hypothetical protein
MTDAQPRQTRGRAGPLIRSLAPLGSVVALAGLVSSFVAPFLPLFLTRDLKAGPGLASLFLFLMPLAAVGAVTVVGRLSDRPPAAAGTCSSPCSATTGRRWSWP